MNTVSTLAVRAVGYVILEQGRRKYHPLPERRKGVGYGPITSKNTVPGKSCTGLTGSSVELVYHDGTFGSPLSACELSE